MDAPAPSFGRVARTAAVAVALAASVAVAGEPRVVETTRLLGQVIVEGNAAIPPGSTLRVRLRDLSPGAVRESSVATDAFAVRQPAPIPFELNVDAERIDPKRLYAVEATIEDDHARVLWESPVAIRVLTLGNTSDVSLVLRAAKPAATAPAGTTTVVDCGGFRFDVRLEEAKASLDVAGEQLVLARVASKWGTRYASEGATLLVVGSSAYFERAGKAYRNCTAQPRPVK